MATIETYSFSSLYISYQETNQSNYNLLLLINDSSVKIFFTFIIDERNWITIIFV